MKIKNIMSSHIIKASIHDDAFTCATQMKVYDIGFLPIIDKNKVVGVITDRDIVTKIISNHDKKDIKSYINKNIISINENETIEKALLCMKNNKVKRLLVTDQNKITGVISLSDIIRHIENDKKIKEALLCIFSIHKNQHERITEIDEFYL